MESIISIDGHLHQVQCIIFVAISFILNLKKLNSQDVYKKAEEIQCQENISAFILRMTYLRRGYFIVAEEDKTTIIFFLVSFNFFLAVFTLFDIFQII